jgi:O-antigen/teichoic acid export membrane protein
MGLKQEAVKGVVWSAAQKWGIRAITFLVQLILARLLLPEDFGLVAYAAVFTQFIALFVDAGFSDAIVQFSKIDREHLDTAFWVSVMTGVLISIVCFTGSDLIANLFHEPRLGLILRWLSPVFIFGGLNSVQGSLLRRQLAFKALTMRTLIAVLVSGTVAVILAFLGAGVWSLVARSLVGAIVSVITLWQVSKWRPSFHFSWKHFKELFSFGINITGGDIVDYFSTNADNFLIGYFLGTVALGYYSLAYNLLITLTDLLVTVPNIVAFPIFSKIQNDLDRFKTAFYEATQLQSFIAFPVFLGLLSVAPEAVRVLYTDKWMASVPVIQVLMATGITRSASFFYSSVFRASGKPSWRFGIYTLTALLNVVGFLIVVRMGIVAVAMSYAVVSYALMPLYFYLIQKLVPITLRGHLKQYSAGFLSSLFMVGVVFALRYILGDNFTVLMRLIILVIAGGVTYLLSIRLIRPIMYAKILELVKMALPNSWRAKIERGA